MRLLYRLIALILTVSMCTVPSIQGQDTFLMQVGDNVPAEVESLYLAGLKYLVDSQKSDGTFPDSSFGTQAGVIGLCIVSILAHGEDPNYGLYSNNIKSGISAIIKKQNSQGYIGSSMYNHGFATLALAEAYGTLNDKRVGPALKKAINLILTAQENNSKGGWRYSPTSTDSDTTVSGACLVALLAARNAGVGIPQKAIDKALNFFKSCQCTDGGFGYTDNQGSSVMRTSIAVLVYGLVQPKSPVLKKAYPVISSPVTDNSHKYYFYYYISQALFRMNLTHWNQWNTLHIAELKRTQLSDGSWKGSRGNAFSTAAALLSLALNYRYLPIYER